MEEWLCCNEDCQKRRGVALCRASATRGLRHYGDSLALALWAASANVHVYLGYYLFLAHS